MSFILLVSPSKTARALMAGNVATQADTVVGVSTVREALDTIPRVTPNVIVIDPEAEHVPGETQRLAEVCAGMNTAVLTLVSRPVRPGEVDAHLDAEPGGPGARATVDIGPVTLHPEECRVQGPAGSIYLTAMEMRLIGCLLSRRDSLVSSATLLERVWAHEPGTGSPTIVRAHVRNLRAKLRQVSPGAEIIRTFPRRGYAIVVRPQPAVVPPIFARDAAPAHNGQPAIAH